MGPISDEVFWFFFGLTAGLTLSGLAGLLMFVHLS